MIYSVVGNITGSLFSGSFLSEQDTTLFTLSQSQDVWYGFSANDIIEFGVYNPQDDSLLNWTTLEQEKTFTQNKSTYLDALNNPQSITYNTLDSSFTLYKNNSILVNPIQDLLSIGITDGSYKLSYAFARNMAGSPANLLSIKEISPSRTEVKLIPQKQADVQYTAFCLSKFPTRDVAPVLMSITQKCPYDQIYSVVSKLPQYQFGINFLKFVFFLPDDGSVLTFLKNLYEDFVQYTSLSETQISDGNEPTRIQRIQGIKSYFSNYLLSTFDFITDFNALETKFGEFINIRLDQRFGQFLQSQELGYQDARQFCFDFFFKYYYENAIHPLQEGHQQKYFSYFKNALNFGQGRYFSILSNDFLDERTNASDPLTLILKLSEALPNDISEKDTCWVSNFGMTPFVVTVILQNPVKYRTTKISPANFGAGTQFITKENVNKLYSSDDLKFDSSTTDDITINKNVATLNTDYTDFANFIVFSSADTRLTIFENKMKEWATLSASLGILENRYLTSLSSSVVYPYYLSEKATIQGEMTDVIDSFDGYESYLFSGGKFVYSVASASFYSSSYVVSQHETAQEYDANNRDYLVSNTPEYILNDSNNSEYITFLSMAGHHFDNIYTYISALPIERQIKNEVSSSIPTNTLKQMLSSFGWDVDDIINSLNVDEVYLNSLNGPTYNVLSSEQRLQIIWNRILVNLPGLYKSKGTEECVKFLLSCYGLPSSLISIREYGGTDYSSETLPTYKLDEKTFMARFSGVSDYIEGPIPQSVQAVEFKFTVEEPDTYVAYEYHPLFRVIPYPFTSTNQSVWSIGITRVPGQYSGRVEFRMESGSTGTKISSSVLPIFNGDVFSVLVRRNDPNAGFESTLDINDIPTEYDLIVQRNEDGRRVFYSTSSANFLYTDNSVFAQYGRFLLGNGTNGSNFVGTLDKLSIWDIPLGNADFEEHVDDINSYGFSGSNAYQNLWVKLSVDYPLSLYGLPSGSLSSSIWMNNQSAYYAIPNYYSGDLSSSIIPALWTASLDIISKRWQTYYPTGSVEIIARNFPRVMESNFTTSYDTSVCALISGSSYPYHYRELIYQQDIDASKFGPNKFKNKKIRKVDYEIEARLDSDDKSANIVNQTITGESNQIGFFIDPQDSKNKDIIRYVGRNGIMELIADPADIYNDRYYQLRNKNYEYVASGNKQTYFNELLTVYKFYFDKSIFQAIKNVLPARANVFTGVVVEPTILERPKYQNRPISSSIVLSYVNPTVISNIYTFSEQCLWANFNTDWVLINDPTASYNPLHACANGVALQKAMADSMPPNYFTKFDLTYLTNPVVGYKDNVSVDSIDDFPDRIQHSTYADFENLPRIWEREGGAPVGWPIDPIKGSVTHDKMDDLFVVGPDQNGVLRTSDPTSTGYNQGSHSIVYYMLKVWERYDYYYKSGPYYHTNVPAQNTYASNSVYLYKYITVSEPVMRRYAYWYDLIDTITPNTDPSYTPFGLSYLHRSSTFKGTPDQRVSNVYAGGIAGDLTPSFLVFRPDNVYFEIASGYPTNHYTHKMMQFSTDKHAQFVDQSTNIIYVKGRNTIDTTVNSQGISDGTYPVQSFNTSNVNVVSSTNVIQSGPPDTTTGVIVPSGNANSTAGVTPAVSISPNITQTPTQTLRIKPLSVFGSSFNQFSFFGHQGWITVYDESGRRLGNRLLHLTNQQIKDLQAGKTITINGVNYKMG